MIVSFLYPAGNYTRWTKEAAKDLIGQTFKAKIEDREIGLGKVLQAKVIDDGSALDLTLEWPDDPISQKLLDNLNNQSVFSFKNLS